MISAPLKLFRSFQTEGFDCGIPVLNEWLLRQALAIQQAGGAKTFVAIADGRVVGYYSLTVGTVDHGAAPARSGKGMGGHPVPALLLARLAVDVGYREQGIGTGLLKDAIIRALQAAELAGIRAVLVHARDGAARCFYEQYGFEPSLLDPLQLMLPLKDARKMLEGMKCA